MKKTTLKATAAFATKLAKQNGGMMCRGWLYQPKTPQQLLAKQK